MAKMMKVTHRKETKVYEVPRSMSFSKAAKKPADHATSGPMSKKKK